MPPSHKRKRAEPPSTPRRQSRRLAHQPPQEPAATSPQPRIAASSVAVLSITESTTGESSSAVSSNAATRSVRELSVMTGISDISTDPEPAESWPDLAAKAKKRISKYVLKSRGEHEDKLVDSLLACVNWLPEGGRESMARDILNCGNDNDLYNVFQNLCTGLFYPMKAAGSRSTTTPSPFEKRNKNVETVAAFLADPHGRNSLFRETLLRRDNYRCVVTKDMDTNHWEEIGKPAEVLSSDVEGVHIIPFAYASWKNTPALTHDASNIWEVLWRCFPAVRRAGMSVDHIDDPSNGMILRDNIHKQFGKFRCAFVPTETPNTYKLKTYQRFPGRDLAQLPADRLVTLQAAKNAADISLPNRIFLECHYRIAEILNASGMSKIIEQKMRDWDDIKGKAGGTLNEDGSTDILSFLNLGLWQSVAC